MSTIYRASCDCGFVGDYSSQAKADWVLRKHSCAKHIAVAEAHARGLVRAAVVDRTPKPCLHKEAEHVHGTYSAYTLDRCRCRPCAAAKTAYETNRRRQQAYGRWNGLIDAAPAREHVRVLMAQGMGLKRIVAVSTVPQGQLWKLLDGKRRGDGTRVPSRRIRPETADRILAVELDLADGARVDSTGATRRVRALVALGWSQSKIAAELGIQRSNFTIASGRRETLTVAHDKACRDLYDRWSMRLPPQDAQRDRAASSMARRYAKARGWLPPLAWDDERIDDPEYTPDVGRKEALAEDPELDEAAIQRRLEGDKSVRLSKADAAELVARWRASGRPMNECDRITGLQSRRYIERIAA
ncbi:MAG: hypothetical protein ACRDP4_00205 [Nocardioidaceae bacterium]